MKYSEEKMKQQLLLQLHEQYAINNNNKATMFISFIAGLFAIFTAYGFVLFQVIEHQGKCEYLYIFIITSVVTIFVLGIMWYFAAYLGFDQRKEQFIIHKIREQYGLHNDGSILPHNYCPQGKVGYEIYQGIFEGFLYVFNLIAIIILTLSIITLVYFQTEAAFPSAPNCLCTCAKSCICVIASCLFYWVFVYHMHQCNVNKYRRLCKKNQDQITLKIFTDEKNFIIFCHNAQLRMGDGAI